MDIFVVINTTNTLRTFAKQLFREITGKVYPLSVTVIVADIAAGHTQPQQGSPSKIFSQELDNTRAYDII